MRETSSEPDALKQKEQIKARTAERKNKMAAQAAAGNALKEIAVSEEINSGLL